MIFYDEEVESRFRDKFAWLPMRATEEVSGMQCWVWLEFVRIHRDGRVTCFGLNY